jgi:hypothetical protein
MLTARLQSGNWAKSVDRRHKTCRASRISGEQREAGKRPHVQRFGSRPGVIPGWLRGTMIYFSFTTLTSAGFRDITLMHPFARSFADLEGIIDQLYPATMLARLVTLEIENRWRCSADRDREVFRGFYGLDTMADRRRLDHVPIRAINRERGMAMPATRRLALIGGILLIAVGCTGGNYIQYPNFPDTSCFSCWKAKP